MDFGNVFINEVLESNATFITKLCERAKSDNIGRDPKDEYLRLVNIPVNANGLYLLKIFVAIVTRPEFNELKSKIYRDQRTGEWKMKSEKYLKFEILFSNCGCPTLLECGAIEDQPGNGRLVGYKKYNEFLDVNMKEFGNYFRKFLREALTPPSQQGFQTDDYWKLSVLMIFEIARRVPDGDKFQNLPIAAGILMAMDIPGFTHSELFKLFKVHDRVAVFHSIANLYCSHHLKSATMGTSRNMDHEEIKEKFNELMAIYDDPQSENEDSDDLPQELSRMDIRDSRSVDIGPSSSQKKNLSANSWSSRYK